MGWKRERAVKTFTFKIAVKAAAIYYVRTSCKGFFKGLFIKQSGLEVNSGFSGVLIEFKAEIVFPTFFYIQENTARRECVITPVSTKEFPVHVEAVSVITGHDKT